MKIYSVALITIFASCMSQKVNDLYGVEIIEFGSGGGFAGTKTVYRLAQDGQLFKVDNKNLKLIKRIDAQLVDNLFEKAGKIKSYLLNEPENAYSFLRIVSHDGVNEIIWALGSSKVENNVKILHSELIGFTKLLKK